MLTKKQCDEICDCLLDALPYCDKSDLAEEGYYIGLVEGCITCKKDTSLTYDQYDEIMDYAGLIWSGIIANL